MKKVLFILAIGCLGACKKAEVDKGEVAARVAKQYYDQLIAGNEQAFLDARYQPERIPARYKEQLKENIKMFIAQQKEEHKLFAMKWTQLSTWRTFFYYLAMEIAPKNKLWCL